VTEETQTEEQTGEGQTEGEQSEQRVDVGLSPFGAVVLKVTGRDGVETMALMSLGEVYQLVGQLNALSVIAFQQIIMAQQARNEEIANLMGNNARTDIVLPPNLRS
jgi:hypothetical protein